jgi:hypothetical protein
VLGARCGADVGFRFVNVMERSVYVARRRLATNTDISIVRGINQLAESPHLEPSTRRRSAIQAIP